MQRNHNSWMKTNTMPIQESCKSLRDVSYNHRKPQSINDKELHTESIEKGMNRYDSVTNNEKRINRYDPIPRTKTKY